MALDKTVKLLLVTLSFLLQDAASQVALFNSVPNGYLCINNNYTLTYSDVTDSTACALRCFISSTCLAFTMAEGPCRLFVFNKCSKYVRDCSCSRRGLVFVKQQVGSARGSLCPSDYGKYSQCGVKYKLQTTSTSWSSVRSSCESDGPLTFMADVIDSTEMTYLDGVTSSCCSNACIFYGGLQAPGSVEPAGGWSWVPCNITVDPSLWGSQQPDNYQNLESVLGKWIGYTKLFDVYTLSICQGMCECISPFD